jgi:hypothetical protein
LPIARAGFYRVDGAAPLAANLADAIESDTRPARALVLGGKTIAPPDPPARKPRREIATVALWAAAALALLEWWSYHRRWTV